MKKLPTISKTCLVGSFLFLWLLVSCSSIFASSYYEYSPAAIKTYNLISSLKLEQGAQALKAFKKQDPNNLTAIHLENYSDFFTLFVTEDEKLYNALIKNRELRLKQLDAGPSKDPHYRFIKAEILLQWALVKLKFDKKLSAGSDVFLAYKLLEENEKFFPNFELNKKSLSVLHALSESLPTWVQKTIGFKGSIALGSKEINEIFNSMNQNELFYKEVAIINAYITHYLLNQKNKAWSILQEAKLDHTTNPMFAFLKSSFTLRMGKNEESLKYAIEGPRTQEYLPFYYLDFMVGRALLQKMDEKSIEHINKFLLNFKGKHYIKEGYQKLAWAFVVFNNDGQAYKKQMQNVRSFGVALTDEDKQAQREANAMLSPNQVLLQSRLLFDGGYFARCQTLLIKNEGSLNKGSTKLEFAYRLGRALQSLGNYQDAKQYLLQAYGIGKNLGSYYACNAALQMGLIYEAVKDKDNANKYFNLCLNTNSNEYETSIHQKAKAGLARNQK